MTIDYRQGGKQTDVQTDSLKLPVFKKALQTGGQTDVRTDKLTLPVFKKVFQTGGDTHIINMDGQTNGHTIIWQ